MGKQNTKDKKTTAPGKTKKTKKKTKEKQPWSETLREYVVAILVCLVIALFVVTFVVHPMAVPTPSMHTPPERLIPDTDETLGDYNLLVGDRLIVDKLTIMANNFPVARMLGLSHTICRGEIVVFKSPDRSSNHYLVPYVKRVIALPGETIEIKQNTVFINGKRLMEPYKYHQLGEERPSPFADMTPRTLPEGHYFMMGDNRDFSSDSRDWGFVPEEFIFGKPLFILWSFPDREILHKAFPDGKYRGVHEVNNSGDVVMLYAYRIFYFWKTRWSRMFHLIPRGHCSLEENPDPAGTY